MRLPNDQVLQHTQRYLDLIGGRELSTAEKQAFIAETVESYEKYYNRGFIGYRKSVTEAGQFAALEWSGQGSLLYDLLGREYIDCLGGYGIFSAGVNHPKIVKAVTDQMQRMALNSQELLEPWRAALSRVLAEVTPGRSAELLLHQQRHRRHRRGHQAHPALHQAEHLHLDHRRVPRKVDGLALADGKGVVP